MSNAATIEPVVAHSSGSGNGLERGPNFGRLIERYGPEVRKYIQRRTGDYHESQDLAQETFLQAYRSLDQLRSAAHFRRWMFKIAFHLTIDWRRSRGRSVMSPLPFDTLLESEEAPALVDERYSAGDKEHQTWLKGAVNRVVEEVRSLPDDYGIVLVLRYLEGLSCKEIAAALQISVSNAKVKLHRARQMLRCRLRSLESELAERLS